MESGISCISNREFIRRFNVKTANLRVPISGGLDLTHRCNLRCVHCYLGGEAAGRGSRPDEMGADRIFSIIDQITEAGCLFLLLTGGEPLLRDDFPAIYRRAKENGLLITVFTNGTLITDRILELFDDLPPYCVEVSIYGSTAQTYERITGITGSHEKCLAGIGKLIEHKINVRVKTILMTLNSHEFFDIENIAKALGIRFRFDAAIFPRLNGDRTPLSLRVSPREAIHKEFSDPERTRLWRDYFVENSGRAPSCSLYTCGAGITGFHIDPQGNLLPCIMTPHIKYDLSDGDFLTGWNDAVSVVGNLRAEDGVKGCGCCEKKDLCGYCPAFFLQENGSENVPSDYLCAMGHIRYHLLNDHVMQEVPNAA